jgi:hypothetical protein
MTDRIGDYPEPGYPTKQETMKGPCGGNRKNNTRKSPPNHGKLHASSLIRTTPAAKSPEAEREISLK